MRKKLVAVAAAAAFAVALTPSPASAAAQAGVAVPGSAIGGYATPVIAVAKAAPFNFVNLDALAPHDIVSVAPGPVRGRYLFASQVVSVGGVSEVVGMGATATAGEYEFYCSLHPGTMRGTIVVG